MALHAGYYGIKRGLKVKLAVIAGAWDQIVASIFTRDEQAVLGAKNVFGYTKSSTGIFTVNSDKTVTVNGETPTGGNQNFDMLSDNKLPAGSYILNGCPDGGGVGTYGFSLREDSASGTVIGNDTGSGLQFTLSTAKKVNIRLYVVGGQTISNKVFKPMIRLATDTDSTYAPYAMTNKELTTSAADQKTAINAIITAATGAADFAAFKTAMGAITPVTRSLSKEVSPEDVPEVIEEEKPVTKKTTKKTIVKEGE